ncbi:toll/interleukin-1 receptor domain-containing protein [Microvirga sp. Mcv34]|uniref:toll/interleukin-1 receptor domain-containing protein n=1 Tax=Microvirga sp. Mcv34 TaxID=2926016 RepID=UPI0021C99F47|nr:TIR domain-containing protein [Microvirga sp. Mcv34]
MPEAYEFDVALSFAGEDRQQAHHLAEIVKGHGLKVFYDEFSKATLWGKDLFQHLQSVYKDKAAYCIVFVSEHYVRKAWTKHELQQAQARSFESNREYILPLRLDDTILPGLNATVGYLDLRSTTIEEVAALLLEKMGRSATGLEVEGGTPEWEGDFVEYNGTKVSRFWPEQIEQAQHEPVFLITRPFERIRHGDEKYWEGKQLHTKMICHDCFVLPGQYHAGSCDMEECPACGGQSIACGCRSEPITRAFLEKWENHED